MIKIYRSIITLLVLILTHLVLEHLAIAQDTTNSEVISIPEDATLEIGPETADSLDPARYEEIDEFTGNHRYRNISRSVGLYEILLNGRDSSDWQSGCTASLLSDLYILTAYHCLVDIASIDPSFQRLDMLGARVRFGFLSSKEEGKVWNLETEPVEFSPVTSLDYAILKIIPNRRQGPPTRTFKQIKLFTHDPSSSDELFIIHHPGGLNKRLTRALCRAQRLHPDSINTIPGGVPYRCETVGGSSGAPIFSDNLSDDNKGAVVALHHGKYTVDGNRINFGKRISQIVASSKILAELSCPETMYGIPCQE